MQEAIDFTRHKVWANQPDLFFEQAILDGDGTMVETDGECKQGMDISWKGQWGYHPLVISLANTGEVLRLVNRSGNRPSHEGAQPQQSLTKASPYAAAARQLRSIRSFVATTDFSQTQHLDRWLCWSRGMSRFASGWM